jgi:hypothetical protein
MKKKAAEKLAAKAAPAPEAVAEVQAVAETVEAEAPASVEAEVTETVEAPVAEATPEAAAE